MNDVQTHMRVQDAIETAILDRGVEPPADLADIVFAATRAALEAAPSSLRAQLAEARAEIARLTEERDTMRALIKQENGLMVSNLVADVVKRRNIAATAAAYVESCLCNGGTDVPQLNAAIDRAFAALVAAVEEGQKT